MRQTWPESMGGDQYRHPHQETECDLTMLTLRLCVLFESAKCCGSQICAVYHDWRSCLDRIGVVLEGGLLEDSSANHFFMSLQHRGLSLPHMQIVNFAHSPCALHMCLQTFQTACNVKLTVVATDVPQLHQMWCVS